MSRAILVYGQSGAGKSYSLKNLDPTTTYIIDADTKGSLPWRGAGKSFDKNNFVSTDDLDAIYRGILAIGSDEKFKHIKTLVIDGISKALVTYEATYRIKYNPKNKFEAFQMLKEKGIAIFNAAKKQRADLNIIFIGNVDLADTYTPNSVDKLKVPGQALKGYEPESDFNYVFYAKCIDGEHFFETYPNHSTAKTPEDSFDEVTPNDISNIIREIDHYELGSD